MHHFRIDSQKFMNQRPRLWERGAWLLVVYSVFFGIYGAVNQWIPAENGFDLTLGLDHQIPFVPEAVYPFWLAYVIIPAPAVLFRTRGELVQAGSTFVVLILLSCLIFVLFPVSVPRPQSLPDTLAGALVAHIYQVDQPVCGFPSLHVSASFLAARIGVRAHKVAGLLLFLFCLLTSVATLLIKQHVLLDVAGGVAIALITEVFVDKLWWCRRRALAMPPNETDLSEQERMFP